MRRATGLSSQEFLERYTNTFVGEDGIPLVMLKMVEDDKRTCPFVVPEGCSIYQDRPWSCRMYPVFPISSEEVEFVIEEISTCLGFKENEESTVREWKKAQDIDIYDKMNKAYKEITQHDFFQKGNILDPGKARLIYTACYDLDSFRRFLFQSRFFEKYGVETEDTLGLKDQEMNQLLQSRNKASQ
jgi:hypothetical protein